LKRDRSTKRKKNEEDMTQVHRPLAVELFNHTWTLMEKKKRTLEENDEMIHSSHASRYHWGKVGKAFNLARGEWQISRVYSVLGMPSPALYHAQRCLDYCSKGDVEDWDIPFAYEALARASAVAGKRRDRAKYLKLASRLGARIRSPDDRKLLFNNLKSVPEV
jgi:hypothetical protein